MRLIYACGEGLNLLHQPTEWVHQSMAFRPLFSGFGGYGATWRIVAAQTWHYGKQVSTRFHMEETGKEYLASTNTVPSRSSTLPETIAFLPLASSRRVLMTTNWMIVS